MLLLNDFRNFFNLFNGGLFRFFGLFHLLSRRFLNFNFYFFNNFVWLIGHMFIIGRNVQEKSIFLHESEIECDVVRNNVISIVIFTSPLSKLIHHQLIRLTQFSTRTMQITVWANIHGFLLIFTILHLPTPLHKQWYLISVKFITNLTVSNFHQNPFRCILIKIHGLCQYKVYRYTRLLIITHIIECSKMVRVGYNFLRVISIFNRNAFKFLYQTVKCYYNIILHYWRRFLINSIINRVNINACFQAYSK